MFTKIDLDKHLQPALIRLQDDASFGSTDVTEARFNMSGAQIIRFGSQQKPKSFSLNTEEMDALADAWMEYRGRVIQHAADIERQKEAAIAEAKQLAVSTRFDYEPLNIQISQEQEDDYWHIRVPALNFNRYQYENGVENLPELVREALATIHDNVKLAEENSWDGEWTPMIASYRRVFPLEPQEITQAKRLLTEANVQEWEIHKNTDDTWDFLGPFGDGGQTLFANEDPDQLLADIKEYLDRKATDRLLAAMEDDTEQREPDTEEDTGLLSPLDIIDDQTPESLITEARELLEQSAHPAGWVLEHIGDRPQDDRWSFDNGLNGEQHFSLLHKSAAEMYNLINAYLIDIPRSEQEALN